MTKVRGDVQSGRNQRDRQGAGPFANELTHLLLPNYGRPTHFDRRRRRRQILRKCNWKTNSSRLMKRNLTNLGVLTSSRAMATWHHWQILCETAGVPTVSSIADKMLHCRPPRYIRLLPSGPLSGVQQLLAGLLTLCEPLNANNQLEAPKHHAQYHYAGH
jgi:hypothetical protein